MIDAAALLHFHGQTIDIKHSRMTDVDFDVHGLPTMDLMIQFCIRPSQSTWVSDDAQVFNHDMPLIAVSMIRRKFECWGRSRCNRQQMKGESASEAATLAASPAEVRFNTD